MILYFLTFSAFRPNFVHHSLIFASYFLLFLVFSHLWYFAIFPHTISYLAFRNLIFTLFWYFFLPLFTPLFSLRICFSVTNFFSVFSFSFPCFLPILLHVTHVYSLPLSLLPLVTPNAWFQPPTSILHLLSPRTPFFFPIFFRHLPDSQTHCWTFWTLLCLSVVPPPNFPSKTLESLKSPKP